MPSSLTTSAASRGMVRFSRELCRRDLSESSWGGVSAALLRVTAADPRGSRRRSRRGMPWWPTRPGVSCWRSVIHAQSCCLRVLAVIPRRCRQQTHEPATSPRPVPAASKARRPCYQRRRLHAEPTPSSSCCGCVCCCCLRCGEGGKVVGVVAMWGPGGSSAGCTVCECRLLSLVR